MRCRRLLILVGFCAFVPAGASTPQGPPRQPLEEIVQHFAQKELEYARAHALYRYRLSVKVQELGSDDSVLGEFEQKMEVSFDRSGRRAARLLENPRVDLAHLKLSQVGLEDLEFIPLFILAPEEIPDYEITYLTSERVDEVDTYLFRLKPNRPVRPQERLFEGLIWVDADKLDIVRAHGRALPARAAGVFSDYFQRVEVFREPVDGFLFPTYVRSLDVLQARGERINARLVVRFTDHQRVTIGAE